MKNQEEFNLSEKIYITGLGDMYLEEDVKEFLRLLKERLPKRVNDYFIHLIIDELAGDKLI